MTDKTAVQCYEAIRTHCEDIISDAEQMFPEAASPGDVFRQGDIYIWREEDDLPTHLIPLRGKDAKAQLVDDNSRGARHILENLEGVELFRDPEGDALQGPWFRLATEKVLTHPDHGNVRMPPGNYSITRQRARAEDLRAVRD